MPATNPNNMMLVKNIVNRLSDNESIKTDLNNFLVSNNAFTTELRFYGGKKPGARGLYFSLYGRCTKFKIDYLYNYDGNSKYTIPLKINATGAGGGAMIGKQWLIAKHVTLDSYILGGHYGTLKGTANGAADLSSMPEDEK
ncbi:MAG: hypothetical protein ACR2FN_14105 [Chitinophagaceae bacterium]